MPVLSKPSTVPKNRTFLRSCSIAWMPSGNRADPVQGGGGLGVILGGKHTWWKSARPGLFPSGFSGLRDARAKAEVARRVRRLALGNPGDVKPVGGGVSELRIHYGPGHRVYVVQRGSLLIILLCGGDIGDQAKDIALAPKLAKEI